jgi:hypothetical protein
VPVAGVSTPVADPLEAGRLSVGPRPSATMGRGRAAQPWVPGGSVVSAARVVPPKPKQHPGTVRERAKRAKAHAQHRAHTQGRQTSPPSAVAPRDAQTGVLCTTAPTVTQAVVAYAGRLASAATSRDWQHHGAVRTAVVGLPTAARVARLLGVVCVA